MSATQGLGKEESEQKLLGDIELRIRLQLKQGAFCQCIFFKKNNCPLFLVLRLTQPLPASWLLRQSCVD